MKNLRKISFTIVSILFSIAGFAQANKKTMDYLNIPGPIVFDGKSYNLSWSSHPAPAYYKQEYIQKGDNAERFKSMILLDVLTGDADIKNIVSKKIDELKQMKLANPMVNYESFDNPKTGEYIVDFLVSANAADGTTGIVERNVYRYKSFTDKSGKKAVLLFGISERSYGNDIDKFLVSLKSTKKNNVNAIAKYVLPAVNVE